MYKRQVKGVAYGLPQLRLVGFKLGLPGRDTVRYHRGIGFIIKSDLTSNDSFLAQGGMCMLKEQSDYDSFFEDTMKAGHYENDPNIRN